MAQGPGVSGLAPGGRIGEFRVLERLGSGGGGEVFRVQDALGRQLALKLLAGRLDDSRLERFAREGELTAALRHPGIVSVHAQGTSPAGRYLVYELVEGEDLERAWRRLSQAQLLQILAEVADAVGHAHARGVVHRDLKPANVLLDARDRARVTDFGLALGAGMERLTRTGAIVGTPFYMAPEQVRGKRERVGPPTDVWALGVLLYRALTGRLPFDGQSLVELMARVAESDPPAPRALAPECSPALEAVCLRALRRDPGERYPDAAAFGAGLRAALAGPAGVGGARGRWLLLILGLLLTSSAAAGVALWSSSSAPTPALEAPQPAPEGPAPTPAARADGAVLDRALAAGDLERAQSAARALLADGLGPAEVRARAIAAAEHADVALELLGELGDELPPTGDPAELRLANARFAVAFEALSADLVQPDDSDAALAAAAGDCLRRLQRLADAGLRVRSPRAMTFCETLFTMGRFRAIEDPTYWELVRVAVRLDLDLPNELLQRGVFAPDAERPWGRAPTEFWARYVEGRIAIEVKRLSGPTRGFLLRLVQGEALGGTLGPTQRALVALELLTRIRHRDPVQAQELIALMLELAPQLPQVHLAHARAAAREGAWPEVLARVREAQACFETERYGGCSLTMGLDDDLDALEVEALAQVGEREQAQALFRSLLSRNSGAAEELRQRYPWLER
ncbi:MAG: protein kinase [Planctomycetota bacterium]